MKSLGYKFSFYFVVLLSPWSSSLTNGERLSSGCNNNDSPDPPFEGVQPGETFKIKRRVSGTQRRTHEITLPRNYDAQTPSPMMLYFHGWTGNENSCGRKCEVEAAKKGFVSVAMSGYGMPFSLFLMVSLPVRLNSPYLLIIPVFFLIYNM